MSDSINRETFVEELWCIFNEHSTSEIFAPLRNALALPPPHDPLLLSSKNEISDIPDERDLNEQFGILIENNPDNFEPLGVTQTANGVGFNATELTARFVSFFLSDIRNIICESKQFRGISPKKIVVQLSSVIAVGMTAVSQATLLAISALILLIIIKDSHSSFCKITNTDLINIIIDPNAAFEKKEHLWIQRSDKTPSKRPVIIIVTVSMIFVVLSIILLLSKK